VLGADHEGEELAMGWQFRRKPQTTSNKSRETRSNGAPQRAAFHPAAGRSFCEFCDSKRSGPAAIKR
jgi:hypothetical protein